MATPRAARWGAAWRINRAHPAIAAFAQPGSETEALLRVLEGSLPVHDIHLHLSNDLPIAEEDGITEAEMEILARRILDAFQDQPAMVEGILGRLHTTDPFNRDPDGARRLAAKLRK